MVFHQYAQYYDVFYKDKEYKREILYLRALFRKYGKTKIKTILDLGCGTGGHMIPLLQNGFLVMGVDISAQMLKVARSKLNRAALKADLKRGSLQTFRLHKKFDAVLCLFSVINYAAAQGDIVPTLRNITRHLKKQSLFIFDFWNASAVVDYYRPRKSANFRKNGMDIERQSVTKVYPSQKRCEVNYSCILRQDGRVIRHDKEKHVLRYFSPEEMTDCLRKAGLKVVDMHPFLHFGGKIRRNSWDLTAVAQKA